MVDLFDRAAWGLDPGVLHLNHGSFGAVPNVLRAEQDRWRNVINANPTAFYSRQLVGELDVVRRSAAEFLHADEGGLILLPNVTWAAAMVLASVPLERGDEVVITDDTYESVRAAATEACARVGARVIQAALPAGNFGDGRVITQAIEGSLTAQTKLAIIDHITSPTAALVDLAPTVQQCHANGTAVFVDGAHAPGMLALDVEQSQADFYAGSFHKWCCAPHGAAFLAVAPPWRDRMRSPVPGSESRRGFPAGLEWWGTMDYSALLSTPTAFDLLREHGVDTLRQHNATLVSEGAALVSRAFGQEPAPPSPISMVALEVPSRIAPEGADCRALRARIAGEIGAEVVITMARRRPVLRLSAHAYNRYSEFQELARYLAALA